MDEPGRQRPRDPEYDRGPHTNSQNRNLFDPRSLNTRSDRTASWIQKKGETIANNTGGAKFSSSSEQQQSPVPENKSQLFSYSQNSADIPVSSSVEQSYVGTEPKLMLFRKDESGDTIMNTVQSIDPRDLSQAQPTGSYNNGGASSQVQGLSHPDMDGSADGSPNTEFSLPTVERLVGEMQNTYFEITKLEEKCNFLYQAIASEKSQHSPDGLFHLRDLYHYQSKLCGKYFNFLFLAYHPTGTSVTRALVSKYRIPLRLWNKGVFRYLDFLREYHLYIDSYFDKAIRTTDLIIRYAYFCISLLSMLVESPYDSGHMWMEALGDIARFILSFRNGRAYSQDVSVDWRKISEYWYCQSINRSPMIGRLYHHYSALYPTKIGSFSYLLKSLIVETPYEQSREMLSSLFKSTKVKTSLDSFITLHHVNYYSQYSDKEQYLQSLVQTGNGAVSTSALYHEWLQAVIEYIHHMIEHEKSRFFLYEPILAYCNIVSLLGYGSRSNLIYDHFYSKYQSEQKLETGNAYQPPIPEQSVQDQGYGNLNMSLELSYKVMKVILTDSLYIEQAGSRHAHMLIWLYFWTAISDRPDFIPILFQNSHFPHRELIEYLNSVLNSCLPLLFGVSVDRDTGLRQRISSWKKEYSDPINSEDLYERLNRETPGYEQRTKTPLFRERPLPEERELLGLIWAKGVVDPLYYDFATIPVDKLYAFPESKSYNPVRVIRVLERALELASVGDWLVYGNTGFQYSEHIWQYISNKEKMG